jgi:hypothetical protein
VKEYPIGHYGVVQSRRHLPMCPRHSTWKGLPCNEAVEISCACNRAVVHRAPSAGHDGHDGKGRDKGLRDSSSSHPEKWSMLVISQGHKHDSETSIPDQVHFA